MEPYILQRQSIWKISLCVSPEELIWVLLLMFANPPVAACALAQLEPSQGVSQKLTQTLSTIFLIWPMPELPN